MAKQQMMKKLTYKTSPSLLILIGFFVVIVGYGLWRSSALIKGPEIAISSPIDGGTVLSTITTISGRADRISAIFLDGKQIFTDNEGFFKETLLLAEGYNIIQVKARDRFGRETEKIIKVAAPAAKLF